MDYGGEIVLEEQISTHSSPNNNSIKNRPTLNLNGFEASSKRSESNDKKCSNVYGELILLGYNGNSESGRSNGRKNRSKMVFQRRAESNGVKKGRISEISAPPRSQAVQDSNRHTVSYVYDRSHTVLVEYLPDAQKDMFQIGRSSEAQIDFTIVDTWLAADDHHNHHFLNATVPHHHTGNGRRSHAPPQKQGGGGGMTKNGHYGYEPKSVSSTISRYACRILMDRDEPNKAYVYAAGFDLSKNIFLGEKATKWQKKNGECDGLTTNGILILHPNRCIEDDSNGQSSEMYTWREVSVDGDIYSLRETRSATNRGELYLDETNQLQDGTLIDLCGATLLWRSSAGLTQSPSREELERRLDELNAGKPQCPVNLNTLIIPRKKVAKSNSSRQPYAYLSCGHVQGKHSWGVIQNGSLNGGDSGGGGGGTTAFRCPICMIESEKIIQLTMGMESAFHLDSGALDYAFNPCGHVASHATVRYWSRIPLPHGTASFFPVCPFCTCILAKPKPFVRLIFQDHCFDD